MPARRLLIAAGLVALAAAAAGCGHSAKSSVATTSTPAAKPERTGKPLAPHRALAPPREATVIRRWSDTLRGGDEIAAARFFAVPSLVQIQPGTPVYHITRRAQAVAFQAVLPCGARLLRAERDGRYVNALFRLTMRPGGKCDAPGQTARTDFVIRGGKITEWRRAPDEPGDKGGGTPPAPAAASA